MRYMKHAFHPCSTTTQRISLTSKGTVYAGKRRNYPTSVSRCFSKSTSTSTRGGPSVIDLIKIFPSGVKKLYNDVQLYQNIKDAASTKQNIWSTLNRIPRRQQEQQKRLLRELKKVTIPVTLAILPAIGNIFIALIAIQPRPFLSNHFFTEEQIRFFVSRDYYRRRAYFSACADDFWHIVSSDADNSTSMRYRDKTKSVDLVYESSDNGGPVFDNIMLLFSLFQGCGQDSRIHHVKEWKVSQFNAFPREKILNIAFSSWLASPTLWVQPSMLIHYRLHSLAQEIIQDDIALIEEKQHVQNCSSLTHNELLDACFMRSLPCGLDQSVDAMRQSLCGHLKMMKQVLDDVGPLGLQCTRGSQFVFYLHAIRHEYKGRPNLKR